MACPRHGRRGIGMAALDKLTLFCAANAVKESQGALMKNQYGDLMLEIRHETLLPARILITPTTN